MALDLALSPSWSALRGTLSLAAKLAVCDALTLPGKNGEPETLAQASEAGGLLIPTRLAWKAAEALAVTGEAFTVTDTYCGPDMRCWPAANGAIMGSWGLRGAYQPEAISALLQRRGGILAAAAGSGKTIVAARVAEAVAREWAKPPMRLLWVAQTVEQVAQAEAALSLIPDGVRARMEISCGCWQGVARGAKADLAGLDFLVGDEVHSAADAMLQIAQACTGAWWRIGLSATPVRGDDRELAMMAAWGRIAYRCSQADVRGEGFLVPCRVIVHDAGEKDEIKDAVEAEAGKELNEWLHGKGRWAARNPERIGQEFRRISYRIARRMGILENARYHDLAAAIAAECAVDGPCLALVATREQGREIVSRVPGARELNAKVARKARASVVADAKAGDCPVLVATSAADQGLDVPVLASVVMAGGGRGGKDAYLLEQRAARAQRVSGGKAVATIHDFMHLAHPVLRQQSYLRLKGYKALGYEISSGGGRIR